MARYGITNHFKGGTKEQYDRTVEAVHPDGGARLPAGQLYHAAGATPDGFVVVAIWDSRASWEKFRDETLISALASVEGALPGPPETVEFEIHNEMTA